MIVGAGMLVYRIHDCHSLKGKRGVVRSIIRRLQNQFNASVAEVGANDVYQRAEIGFSLVGNDARVINAKMDKLINLADALGLAELVETDTEILHL
jgi:uncharacterized protein YlxP (DUF503 family)